MSVIYADQFTPLAPPQWGGEYASPISRVWVCVCSCCSMHKKNPSLALALLPVLLSELARELTARAQSVKMANRSEGSWGG